MKRRIFIIHGWDATPSTDWFPWLKEQLEAYDLEVHVPAMPDPSHPVIDTWVGVLAAAVGELRDTDIFVGHSVGCQTILRYLETQAGNDIHVPVICVAGWFTLNGLDTEEEKQIARPWLETSIDFDAIKDMCEPLDVILSDDDPYVALSEHKRLFEDLLGGFVFVQHNMGHFSIDHGGVRELPIVRDIIVELIK